MEENPSGFLKARMDFLAGKDVRLADRSLPGGPPMYAVRTNRGWINAVSSAVLLSTVLASVPAYGLRIDRYPGCGELCRWEYLPAAEPKEITAALTEQPATQDYRRIILRNAVLAENTAAVETLLRAGAPPNGREAPGRYDSMLHEAARRGGGVVDLLLEAGAFPNVVIDGNKTPLHVAVQSGQVGAVASLLKAGADPRATNSQGFTALELAQRATDGICRSDSSRDGRLPPPSRSCRDELLALLRAPPVSHRHCGRLCEAKFWRAATLEEVRIALTRVQTGGKWSAPDGGPLHLAAAMGAEMAVVELLLDHGINPNGRDVRDDTPLHVAARQPGRADLVRLLLQRGAWRDALNGRDWTPLHAASEHASTFEAMRVLLDAGADPDARADHMFGLTPRQLAAAQPGGPAAAELMLSHPGVRGFAPGDLLASMLKSAAAGGHPATVETLLRQGAKAHDPDIFGNTALHGAAAAGNIETMRALLNRGAEPGHSKYDAPFAVLSGEGERPLHKAIRHPAAVELLLQFGADPDGRTLRGKTPLHVAAEICAGASLLHLLDHGAAPDVQDQYGDTPLHAAVWRIAGSQEHDRLRQRWVENCENPATERAWHLEQCKNSAILHFQEELETRDECLQNVAALLRFGANPNMINAKIGSGGGVTPLEMASQPEVRERLGAALIRMMEEASKAHSR